MLMYATPTFITEALRLVTKVELLLSNCYSDITAYTVLAYSCWVSTTTLFNSNAMPTTDSCHIKAVEFV